METSKILRGRQNKNLALFPFWDNDIGNVMLFLDFVRRLGLPVILRSPKSISLDATNSMLVYFRHQSLKTCLLVPLVA